MQSALTLRSLHVCSYNSLYYNTESDVNNRLTILNKIIIQKFGMKSFYCIFALLKIRGLPNSRVMIP